MSHPSTFRHPFEGAWKNGSFLYTIERRGPSVSVFAIDTDDGEVFPISNVEISADTVRFHLYIPSNGYRMEHVFLPHEGGFLDRWTGIDTDGTRRDHEEMLTRA